jgi:hyperosmotically inducible periplasmic protein
MARKVRAMRYALRLVSLAAVLIIVLTGCTALTGKTAGQTIDDAGITAAVKAKLAGEKLGTVTKIDVDTNKGIVHLTGNVENLATKARATEVARRVSGVKDVVNNLKIQGPVTNGADDPGRRSRTREARA